MKQQRVRIPLHQNAKVQAIIMAINALIILIPMFLMAYFTAAPQGRQGAFILLLMPIVYLALGYIVVAIGCAIYNFLFKYIGGIEFESSTDSG
jgi:hypothetical protein